MKTAYLMPEPLDHDLLPIRVPRFAPGGWRLWVALSIAAIGCNGRPGTEKPGSVVNADKAAIRSWLRTHRDEAEFEEVRWWGPVTSEAIKQRRVAALESQAEAWRRQVEARPKRGGEDRLYTDSDLAAIEAMNSAGAFVTYRLRYRQMSNGRAELIDSVFIVHSNQVEEFPMCSENYPMGWVLLDPRVWFIEEQLRERNPDAVLDPSAIRTEAQRMCEQ